MKKALFIVFLILCFGVFAKAQQNQVLSAAASSCTATSASCLLVTVDPGQGGATFTVSSNAGANTIQFEASGNFNPSTPANGIWVALNVTPSNSTTAVTSTTSTGVWQANVAGYTAIRMRMSTQASGNSTVSINGSFASARAGGGGGLAPNSPGIPSANGNVYYATNYGAAFNALNLLTCSGTSGQHSLTCTGTGTNFIATDVGKSVWESGNGSTVSPDLGITTISAVVSTTNVTVTGTFTRNSSNGEAVYGTDDTTAINTIPYEGPLNCNTSIHFPAGGTIFSAAILNTNVPARCSYDQTTNIPELSGEGTGATIFYISPAFTFGTSAICTAGGGYCLGAGGMSKRDFTVSGGNGQGLLVANTYNGCFMGLASPAYMENVTLYSFVLTGNAQAVCVPSGGAWLYNVDVYGGTGNGSGAGCTGFAISGAAVIMFNSYVVSACTETPGDAMQFSGGADAVYTSYGVSANNINGILISGGSTLFNQMDSTLGITVSGASTTAWINNSSIPTSAANETCNLNVTTGATVYLHGSNLKNTSGSGTNYSVCIDATSTVVDEGGNQLSANTAPANFTSGATWKASGGPAGTMPIVAQLGGASACTASQTLFLFPWGQTASDACNSATPETQIGGWVAPRAGTLYSLSFSATTGGVATDAATIYQNGSPSTITCTYGTGTSCTDVTHTLSVAAGDTIGCAIVTHVADTTVKPVCSVVLF